jgi:hypothetical protein
MLVLSDEEDPVARLDLMPREAVNLSLVTHWEGWARRTLSMSLAN